MSHSNTRPTLLGRHLLIRRVREQGWAVAHAARARGISRQCAHRRVKRFDELGEAGLRDRSSRPHASPSRTQDDVEARVVELRERERRGQDWIGAEPGIAPRSVPRILRRHRMPYLRELDPLTGEQIRASKSTVRRYERECPGDLVHVDVKKIGRIPDGGGWKAHGRQMGSTAAKKKATFGYDFVHSMVDDHSRFAYSEILPDEKGSTTAGFLARALAAFTEAGIAVRQVLTDNHWSYSHSREVAAALAGQDVEHLFIKPHCPWQNGKVERFNRTLAVEWAYRQVFTSNADRCAALGPWLNYYNTQRRHSALGGQPPISKLSPT